MKKKGAIFVISCVIAFLGSMTNSGCKNIADNQSTPVGVLLRASGCKLFETSASGRLAKFAPGPHEDCVAYEYNGVDTLVLSHINAAFNCCPGQISTEIDIDDDRIVITEKEREQGCYCLCLRDLYYEVVKVRPGAYTIRFVEPYVKEGDPALELSIDLSSACSGDKCVQRDYPPWAQ